MTSLLQKELTTEKQFKIMIPKHPKKPESIKENTRAGVVKDTPGIQEQAAIFPEAAQHTKGREPPGRGTVRVDAELHHWGNLIEMVSRDCPDVSSMGNCCVGFRTKT